MSESIHSFNMRETNPMNSELSVQIDHSQSREMQLLSYAQSNSLEQFQRLLQSDNFDLITIRNQRNFTVLHYACFNSEFKMVSLIIHYYETNLIYAENLQNFINSITNEDYAPIHFASYRGNIEILTLLKEKGANLNLLNKVGLNILHIGAQGGQPNSIAFAIENGLQLSQLDFTGGSALHWACYYGQEKSFSYLIPYLEQKSPFFPLNLLDKQNLTPLHLAVMNGNTRLVKRLLIYGADKRIKGRNNKTPAELAQENDFKNIYGLLTKERNCLVAFFNLRQAVKRVRKSIFELFRFIGFMLFIMFVYYIYIFDEERLYDIIAYGILIFMFLLVVLKNPGYQKRQKKSLLTLLQNYDSFEICPICNIVRLPRSKHCDICQKCVMVYDHHCPWINNCVGSGNHLIFMLFIIYLDSMIILAIILTMIQLIDGLHSEYKLLNHSYIAYSLVSISFVIEIIFTLGITALIITQIQNILIGQTTFERFAIQNNTSTMRSLMGNNQSSVHPDEEQQNQRFNRYSCKNICKFYQNGYQSHKQEKELLLRN